jgi:hypothetical protein
LAAPKAEAPSSSTVLLLAIYLTTTSITTTKWVGGVGGGFTLISGDINILKASPKISKTRVLLLLLVVVRGREFHQLQHPILLGTRSIADVKNLCSGSICFNNIV